VESFLPLDGATVTIAPSNRRRWHRHKISLPLELRDERVKRRPALAPPM